MEVGAGPVRPTWMILMRTPGRPRTWDLRTPKSRTALYTTPFIGISVRSRKSAGRARRREQGGRPKTVVAVRHRLPGSFVDGRGQFLAILSTASTITALPVIVAVRLARSGSSWSTHGCGKRAAIGQDGLWRASRIGGADRTTPT